MGLAGRETFVPQRYDWGWEAQADWYDAEAELEGERCTLQVFSLRSMASGAAFHRAYRRATQQAFLEAHELAFHYFGGVFRQVRTDFVPGNKIGLMCPSPLCALGPRLQHRYWGRAFRGPHNCQSELSHFIKS